MGKELDMDNLRADVAEADSDESVGAIISPACLERPGDPATWVKADLARVGKFDRGEITELQLGRSTEIYDKLCRRYAHVPLEDAGREMLEPIERVVGLFESSIKELEVLEESFRKIDDLRLSAEKKKRYSDLIRRCIALQEQAREDPCKFWVYVGRDSEATADAAQERFGVFDMQGFHVEMFDLWNDPKARYSLVEAPPAHGKSVNLRGYAAWRMGRQPKIRILLLTDADGRAGKDVLTLMRVIESPRYKAIFPHIRMLNRTDMVKQSSRGFTLASRLGDKEDFNIHSREPTLEGFAIGSNFQGSGYDIILPDDMVLPDARTQKWYRDDTNRRWEEVARQRLRNPSHAEVKMVATPWDEDDVYGRIERQQRDGVTRRWTILKFPILEDESGHEIPIWPDKFSQEVLEYEKATSQPDRYACLYRLDPRHESTRLVKKMHYYQSLEDEFTTENDRKLLEALKVSERWLSLDPAGSATKGSADNGVIEGAITPNGFGFITGCWSLKLAPVPFKEWVVERVASAEGRGYHGIQIEGQASNKMGAELFLDDLRKMLAERGIKQDIALIVTDCRVGGHRQNIGKRLRVRESAWLVESARVRFAGHRYRAPVVGEVRCGVMQGSNMAMLANNLLNFDTASNKDVVDALTQWLLYQRHRLADARPEADVVKEQSAPDELTRLFRKSLADAGKVPDRYDEELAFMTAM